MTPRTHPRVLLVGIGLELAGSARFLTGLAAGLDRDGWETGLFVVRSGPLRPELEGTGVDLVVAAEDLPEYAGRLRLGVAPFFRLVSVIRRTRPDVVHTNLFGLDVIGRIAALLCGVPVVMSTQHDLNPRPWFVNAYRRLTVGRIAATVACSRPVAEYCRQVMKVPEDRLVVIENGIDAARLAAPPEPMRPSPAFLTMGALVPAKAHGVLLDAFARVLRARPDVTLTISGDGPLREPILAQVRELGMEDAVRVAPPTPDVVGLLRGADVFMQPSLREGLPQAMLEAMAASKPVVATDVSSHAAVLGGGRCGLLVPPGDAAALADAMLAAIADPAQAAAMGARARDRVLAHYSLERMVGEYEALYARLLEVSGGEREHEPGRPAA